MGPGNSLSCRELTEIITDYLEGAMTAAQRKRFDDHVAECKGCAHYLQQMRHTIAITGRLTEEQVPEEAKERLLAAFRDWKSGA
jgi:anti-sigma factor (TIGR02949 family)